MFISEAEEGIEATAEAGDTEIDTGRHLPDTDNARVAEEVAAATTMIEGM